MNSTARGTPEASRATRQWQADLLLLVVTLIWGSTFVLVKQAVAQFPVFAFLFLRFTIASASLAILFGKSLRGLSARNVVSGIVIGLFLLGGYGFQTVGLQYTSASKAGFITGLSVVLVPLFSTVVFRRAPARATLSGVGLATIGMALLTLEGDLRPGAGDLIVLAGAICFALHILAVSRFAPHGDPLGLTIVQIATVAVCSGILSLVTEPRPEEIQIGTWLATAFTGIMATAFAFGVQNYVQRWTTATHTALVFSSEPVFAALFGFVFASERLTSLGLTGCLLILLGMLVAEMGPRTTDLVVEPHEKEAEV